MKGKAKTIAFVPYSFLKTLPIFKKQQCISYLFFRLEISMPHFPYFARCPWEKSLEDLNSDVT